MQNLKKKSNKHLNMKQPIHVKNKDRKSIANECTKKKGSWHHVSNQKLKQEAKADLNTDQTTNQTTIGRAE